MADISIENNIKNLHLNVVENGNTEVEAPESIKCKDIYGFNLVDLYKLALKFYKEKEGKAVNLSYQDRLRLVALVQQVNHGKLNIDKLPSLGVLDVIGRDRRDAWQALGDTKKEAAMLGFIEILDNTCPLFKTFIEAQKRDSEEKKKLALLEEERKQNELIKEKERKEQMKKEEEEREIAEQQKRQVQEALNQQTFHQFKAYAEQQYPGNPEQQAVLVRQLQEQHYHQYMQQLLQQQSQAVQTAGDSSQNASEEETVEAVETFDNSVELSEDENDDGLPAVSPPSMWTRKDIKEFKESIRKEGGDAIIRVGHGETVTVRVPTHEDGTCLFWEFATDSYDIGFGVYFEWTKSPTNQVSVHIQESDDDEGDFDEEELEEDEEYPDYPTRTGDDIEKGKGKLIDDKDRPLITAIVPIYRRDCQDEVYAGSHVYPGQGVYLLKFDNSYSLWRSKTLYYRVYYTR